jgi:hypothetical protein
LLGNCCIDSPANDAPVAPFCIADRAGFVNVFADKADILWTGQLF